MTLRREWLLTLSGLVLLNLLLAFGAIGLFGRMGPAIERILLDNVNSIRAAEEILAELAVSHDEVDADRRATIESAFERIRTNVTEPEEEPLVEAIREKLPAALEGGRSRRAEVVDQITELIAVNRRAMIEVDREARRLGVAGAWAAVGIGFLSFLAGLSLIVRFRKRILDPLQNVHEVLADVRSGSVLRRCRPSDAPYELEKVADSINHLLDERLTAITGHRPEAERTELATAALTHLLEASDVPRALVSTEGELTRCNTAMLDLLASDRGPEVRDWLADPEGEHPFELERIAEYGWLIQVAETAAEP